MSILSGNELVLYGFVGEETPDGGFTSQDVLNALAEIGRDADVTVRMNSGGGYVHEGLAIYNALVAHKGEVTVQVDSIVASSASLIAMAGDRIVMEAGSLMMIHDPSGMTFGTADDHEKTRIALDKMGDAFADIYAGRSGKSVSAIRALMKAETWFDGADAVAAGLATEELPTLRAKEVAAFDYRAYAHAPECLVAAAAANGWGKNGTARHEANHHQEERPMTKRSDVFQAAYDEGYAAEQDRIRAILADGHKRGNSTLAEYLAFDTRMTPAEAKAVIEVAIVSQETGDMERGRSGAEAYAQRRAADSVIGTREVAAQDVDRILRHSASNRSLGSAAAAAHGWKKAASSINASNGHEVQVDAPKGKFGRS